MPRNKITDLRNHLFETIENLLDPDSNMDIHKAQTIAQIGQVIVNAAKVELQFAKMVGSTRIDFIPLEGEEPKAIAEGTPKQKQETEPQSGKAPLPLFGVEGLS